MSHYYNNACLLASRTDKDLAWQQLVRLATNSNSCQVCAVHHHSHCPIAASCTNSCDISDARIVQLLPQQSVLQLLCSNNCCSQQQDLQRGTSQGLLAGWLLLLHVVMLRRDCCCRHIITTTTMIATAPQHLAACCWLDIVVHCSADETTKR